MTIHSLHCIFVLCDDVVDITIDEVRHWGLQRHYVMHDFDDGSGERHEAYRFDGTKVDLEGFVAAYELTTVK